MAYVVAEVGIEPGDGPHVYFDGRPFRRLRLERQH
jgi:hypothetical protein